MLFFRNDGFDFLGPIREHLRWLPSHYDDIGVDFQEMSHKLRLGAGRNEDFLALAIGNLQAIQRGGRGTDGIVGRNDLRDGVDGNVLFEDETRTDQKLIVHNCVAGSQEKVHTKRQDAAY